jgi:hypothetical protein
MGWWLRSLSVTFVVAGTAFGTIYALHGSNGEQLTAEAMKLRPTIDDFVNQGGSALKTLYETSRGIVAPADARTVYAAPRQQAQNQAGDKDGKLPFMVIEPKDFSAPGLRMPQVPMPAVDPNNASDLRLTQAEGQSPMDLSPVEARLRMRVPEEVLGYFDLFLYVSKATPDKGKWAQKVFVLAKTEGHDYQLKYSWPVSTGMEQQIMSPSGRMLGTHTPEGMFKLDRDRSYEDYTSRQWQSPMPYTMFFDWQTEGRPSGLAIHGSDAKGEADLGKRASHGCIRLATANARTLFELIMANYKGRVPQFRIDPDTGTMNTKGVLVRDENGKVRMTRGYKVLVFIEDYGGPQSDTVAALF